MSYVYNSTTKIIASLNQAMRLPTFTDLYYSGPANLGNTALIPETTTSYELGLKYSKSHFHFNFALFSREGKNMIDWIWLADIEKWQTQNIIEQNVSGIEAGFNYTPPISTILKHIYLNYTYLNVHSKKTPYLTKYASTHLKHQLNFGGTLQIIPHLVGSVSFSYRDRVGSFQSYNFVDSKYFEKSYKAVILADAKLRYEKSFLTFYIDGLNLLDQKYFENGVLQPGCWLKAGVVLNLEMKK